MPNLNDFFPLRNTIQKITPDDHKQHMHYLEAVKAFSRITYKSIYVIDYQKKQFEFVSENPSFLGEHSAEMIKEMGYAFYFKYVPPRDLELLARIHVAGFDFYEQVPEEERKQYTISYDFHINNMRGKPLLIHQKVTPLFLTSQGKIWKSVCVVSLSSEKEPGNVKIVKEGDTRIYNYDLPGNFWKANDLKKLNDRERHIVLLSAKGYTINQIAEFLFLSPETIKFHRKKLFEKLKVTNISEAIIHVTNNKLI
ncbi:regulatory protein, luxR family [Sinomicrobium oceani]|uniref:Regulatory protein, luxR family n=1 Tax=Sinomicrobium oceani TaxID=1150368 RepID=A0A1K1S0D3_9FLAO|nr:helix-turn-helix transcriptional regulator [Sinomicrobium oceani]SFW77872.1 regulatory protein, luxR family [Sinomicrobium oceani]